MPKVRTKNFEHTDLEFVPFERNPDLTDDIMQALARMMGWDYVNEIWRRLRVDDTGSIGVTASPSSSAALETSAVTVLTAATLIVAANPNRRSVTLRNNSAQPLYIDDTAGVSTASGYIVPSGDTWSSETYRGDIYGLIVNTSAAVNVIEER